MTFIYVIYFSLTECLENKVYTHQRPCPCSCHDITSNNILVLHNLQEISKISNKYKNILTFNGYSQPTPKSWGAFFQEHLSSLRSPNFKHVLDSGWQKFNFLVNIVRIRIKIQVKSRICWCQPLWKFSKSFHRHIPTHPNHPSHSSSKTTPTFRHVCFGKEIDSESGYVAISEDSDLIDDEDLISDNFPADRGGVFVVTIA